MIREIVMDTKDDKSVLTKHILRFCQVAVDMGYLSAAQVTAALDEQIANDPYSRLRPHRLIGEILLRNGWLTNEQTEMVLSKLQENREEL